MRFSDRCSEAEHGANRERRLAGTSCQRVPWGSADPGPRSVCEALWLCKGSDLLCLQEQ